MKRTGRYKKLTLVAGILPLLSNLSVMRWGLDTSIHRLWLEIALSSPCLASSSFAGHLT